MSTQTQTTGRLGAMEPAVFPLALGCMGMSGMYGTADRMESLKTIHAALEQGVTLLDTGDFYGMGHNELLLGEALQGAKRDKVVVSVKFGAQRDPVTHPRGGQEHPEARRLGVGDKPSAVGQHPSRKIRTK